MLGPGKVMGIGMVAVLSYSTRTRDEMIYQLSLLCILHDMTGRRINRTCRLVSTVLHIVQRA